jgi:hypothetical protein
MRRERGEGVRVEETICWEKVKRCRYGIEYREGKTYWVDITEKDARKLVRDGCELSYHFRGSCAVLDIWHHSSLR